MRENGASDIETIIVALGALSGIETPLLKQAFTIAQAGAGLPDTKLEIENIPIVVQCQECGAKNETQVNKLLCASCGTWRVNIVSGEDMMLKSLVLIDEPIVAEVG